jgi:hypothetical protein
MIQPMNYGVGFQRLYVLFVFLTVAASASLPEKYDKGTRENQER